MRSDLLKVPRQKISRQKPSLRQGGILLAGGKKEDPQKDEDDPSEGGYGETLSQHDGGEDAGGEGLRQREGVGVPEKDLPQSEGEDAQGKGHGEEAEGEPDRRSPGGEDPGCVQKEKNWKADDHGCSRGDRGRLNGVEGRSLLFQPEPHEGKEE